MVAPLRAAPLPRGARRGIRRRTIAWTTKFNDPTRQHQQTKRPSDPLHRGIGRPQPGREDRPCGPQRRGQDHAIPHDHRPGAARRRPGVGRSRHHHRLLQPGRRRDVGAERRGRGDGRRRPGQHRGGRAERAGSRHGGSRAGGRDGGHHRALRRGAGALRGARRLCARRPGPRGAGGPELQPGDDGG